MAPALVLVQVLQEMSVRIRLLHLHHAVVIRNNSGMISERPLRYYVSVSFLSRNLLLVVTDVEPRPNLFTFELGYQLLAQIYLICLPVGLPLGSASVLIGRIRLIVKTR